jgi:sporulation protein YlmC with PRC-barrel domain
MRRVLLRRCKKAVINIGSGRYVGSVLDTRLEEFGLFS